MVYCAVIPPKSLKAAWYSIPSHENDQLPSSQEEEVKNKNIRAIMKGELTSFFFLIYCCQHHRKLQASRFSDGEWWRDSPIRIPSHQCRYCRRPAGCKWARAARAPSATSAAVASHGTK